MQIFADHLHNACLDQQPDGCMPPLDLFDRSLEAEGWSKDGKSQFLFPQGLVDVDGVDGLHPADARHGPEIQQVEIKGDAGKTLFAPLAVIQAYIVPGHPGFVDVEGFGRYPEIGTAFTGLQTPVKFGDTAGQDNIGNILVLKV